MQFRSLEGLMLLGCCALSIACKEDKPPGAPPDLPITAIDANFNIGIPRTDAATVTELPAENKRIAELQGIWQGQEQTQDFGLVRAELVVDALGQIHSQVDGPELHRTDLFVLTQWDGATIGVRTEDGTVLELEAELSGDEIQVTLPQVGKVTLHRKGRREVP